MAELRCAELNRYEKKRANHLQPAFGAARPMECTVPLQAPHVHIALQALLDLVSSCRHEP
jgi:hypothetical protein